VAAGTYIGEPDKEEGAFLGDLATVADGESKGLTLAITLAPTYRKICVLSDSLTAIYTALQLSRGEPPRSGVKAELRDSIRNREQPTAVAWIRGHTGLQGNTNAGHLTELTSGSNRAKSQNSHIRRPQTGVQGGQEDRPHPTRLRSPKDRLASPRPQHLHLVAHRERAPESLATPDTEN